MLIDETCEHEQNDQPANQEKVMAAHMSSTYLGCQVHSRQAWMTFLIHLSHHHCPWSKNIWFNLQLLKCKKVNVTFHKDNITRKQKEQSVYHRDNNKKKNKVCHWINHFNIITYRIRKPHRKHTEDMANYPSNNVTREYFLNIV